GNGAGGNGDRPVRPQVDRELEGEPALRQASGAMQAQALEPLFIRRLPWWKRAVDIVVASTALVVLSPVLLLAAMAVRWTSPGPILFRQMRSGLGGLPFVFYKFRSMVPDAEARKADLLALNEQDGPAFKIRHDPRITAVGRFLRKTSVDELPQLWNVLRGDMSLVGPRPLPCDESDACIGWHRRRLDITPGLTCIWQVEGRSRVSFDDWVRMDIRYMRMGSLLKDATLMIRTLPAMLLRRGV
ncbi:MAG: sugar transferase, partial [Patescibacteria group bacterium]|nr:sugar transferase [Patescibacteria group bacterium]